MTTNSENSEKTQQPNPPDSIQNSTKIEELKRKIIRAHKKKNEEEKNLYDIHDSLQRTQAEIVKKDQEMSELKKFRVQLQQSYEEEEEYITNLLRKKLDVLLKEKEKLIRLAEHEEEFISNNLKKKLDAIKKEKIDIENKLEQEQEYIVNKLQQELLRVSEEKSEIQAKIHNSRGDVLKRLSEQANICGGSLPYGSDSETIKKLTVEITTLEEENGKASERVQNFERERKVLHNRLQNLRKESLEREKAHRELKHELEKVTEERKNLFILAEQVLEKEINNKLRRKKKPGPAGASNLGVSGANKQQACRHRSASELSTADSLSSSIGSSAISTPKVVDQILPLSGSGQSQQHGHYASLYQTHQQHSHFHSSSQDKRRSSSVPTSVSPSERTQHGCQILNLSSLNNVSPSPERW